MKKLFYILVLSFFIGFVHGQNAFNQGNSFYNDGKYQEAIATYESILESGKHSAELYFNLANAYYKTNQIAPSIYYYEKALQLKPNDQDIKSNLSFAQNMTIDAIETIPEVGFSRFMKSAINVFSFDGWAKLSVALVILFVCLFLSYYFSVSTNKKRLLFLSSFTSLLLGLIALSFAFQKHGFDQNNKPAIVFAQQAEVKTEPNLRSESAFNLHEGTKVQILESYDDNWLKVKIADGKTGWISSEDIKAL